jgi:hypothetical protein
LRKQLAKLHEEAKEEVVVTTSDEEIEAEAAIPAVAISKDVVDKLWRFHVACCDLHGPEHIFSICAKEEAEKGQQALHAARPLDVRTRAAQRKVERYRKLAEKNEQIHSAAEVALVAANEALEEKRVELQKSNELLVTAQKELQAVIAESTAAWGESEAAPLRKLVSNLPSEMAARPDVVAAVKASREAWESLAALCKSCAGEETGEAHDNKAKADQEDEARLAKEAEEILQQTFKSYHEQGNAAPACPAEAGEEDQEEQARKRLREAVRDAPGDLQRMCLAAVVELAKRRKL